MSWQAFCRQRQLEMARTDWFAGVFGFVLRAVSFAKSSRQQHSVSTKVEHAVYSVLALVSHSVLKCLGSHRFLGEHSFDSRRVCCSSSVDRLAALQAAHLTRLASQLPCYRFRNLLVFEVQGE